MTTDRRPPMTSRKFLTLLYEAITQDRRFDEFETADRPGGKSIRVYPFDGRTLIVTIKEEG